MPTSTRKSAKLARQAKAATMAASDTAKSNSPQVKRMRAVTARLAKRQKTPQKAKRGNSINEQPQSSTSTYPKLVTAKAKFVEEDREVDFQVEAPAGEFLSEGEVSTSSSDSEIEFEHNVGSSQVTMSSHPSQHSDREEGSV